MNEPGLSHPVRHPLAPIAWYAVVASSNAVVYVLLCELLSLLGLAPPVAAAFALIPVLGLSYLGHKTKTFASNGSHLDEAPRFLVVAGIDLAVAAGVPMVAAGYPRWVSFMALTMIIPVVNFVIMRFWVFRHRDRPRRGKSICNP